MWLGAGAGAAPLEAPYNRGGEASKFPLQLSQSNTAPSQALGVNMGVYPPDDTGEGGGEDCDTIRKGAGRHQHRRRDQQDHPHIGKAAGVHKSSVPTPTKSHLRNPFS